MSKEAAERVLAHWAEKEDDGEKGNKLEELNKDDEPYKQQGVAMDFKADSALSAADYLAPDAGKDSFE